jgi:hypothetical protein
VTANADLLRDDASKSFIGVLKQLDAVAGEEGLRASAIIDRLDERAFGLLILLLSVPCLVPGLPGAQIIAIPIFLLAVQVLLGRKEPWLPRWFLQAQVRKSWINAIADFADKRMRWTERLSRPRWRALATGIGERVAALFMAGAALTVILPITNTIPSIALTLLSIGLIQRDGVFTTIGALVAGAWIGLLTALAAGLYFGASFALQLASERAPWLLEWLGR